MIGFRRKKRIKVNIKLLAGLEQREGYDTETGIEMELAAGTRLKKAVRQLNLPADQLISYIVNGERAHPGRKLFDGDQVFCFLPFAGG
jgi:sulfur carrier protein ThiS